MDRVILHCDMNSFFASVELLSHPELKEVPVAVSGNPDNRHGIILAKNEPAKKAGVVTAETVWQALKKCPNLQFLRPHHAKYREYSRQINAIYYRFTDMVEPFSIDESWLDVTASQKLFGNGGQIADQIRETVKKELGLTLSVGVSFNKIFAKMGSEYKKPDATTIITRENYKDLLWPLPIREMIFIGSATAEKLHAFGIKTIGDLALSDKNWLENTFGKNGLAMYESANGLENSPVALATEKQKIKSVGNGITFKRNLIGEDDIRTAVISLADTVASRLRKYQLKAGGVKVDIKDPYFKTISRQKQLDTRTNLAEEIASSVLDLLKRSWDLNSAIRLLTVTAINLSEEDEAEQLSIFQSDENSRRSREKLGITMDNIRQKFGEKAILFGSVINNDIGIELDETKEE